MKNVKYILAGIMLVTILFQSCEDLNDVETPDFNVTYTNQTIKAGEPIEFKVENAPNFLNFYSGEFSHEYKYRERTKAEGTIYMSFNNAQKWGLGENAKGTLSVHVSSDYDGSGTKEAITQATWTDISDRFNISEAYTYDWTFSGEADITDLDNGGLAYFAIRFYAEKTSLDGHRQPEWRINNFNISRDLDDSGNFLEIFNKAVDNKSGFTSISVDDGVYDWNGHNWYWDSGKKVWRMRSENPRHGNDDWLVTDAINLSIIQPDKGMPLKTYPESLESFTYTYEQPGTYTVTLVGNNTTAYGHKELVKEFTITVTE
ncbi:DUF5017 domain-containing protein [Aestuariivivens insulae]|uniref:DUF5017 domain-containing protein n=1 Tax=Aestuariivivens insulae TaxID=1621988 RepID=UPI001F5A1E5B|nr:DUF5017 domain-containing protein [Aestuariivivens insulae]